MSVHVFPRTLFDATELDWQVTATAWRGSCLELYSRAEASLDQCLEELKKLGCKLGSEASCPAMANRLRALCEHLERDGRYVHGPACLRMLGNWRDHLEHRALVAHGTMAVSAEGVRLTFRDHRGKKGYVDRVEQFDRMRMLTTLTRLSDDQVHLHQQLGQVRAESRRRAQTA